MYFGFITFRYSLVKGDSVNEQSLRRIALDSSYFLTFVLPLGLSVFGLVALVYYFARKEERSRRKTKKLIKRFIEEKAEKRARTKEELAKLNELFKSERIDQETYENFTNVLVMMSGKQEEENDLFAYVTSKSKRQK